MVGAWIEWGPSGNPVRRGGHILSTRRHEKSTWSMGNPSVFDLTGQLRSDVNGVAGKQFIQYYAVFRPASRR